MPKVKGPINNRKSLIILEKSFYTILGIICISDHFVTQVPKAASTSWLHAFLKLANVPDDLIPEDNGMGLHAFLRDKYPLLSKNLNKQFMTKSVKFVVVRHPFERIVSAYLDKLHSYARVRDIERYF